MKSTLASIARIAKERATGDGKVDTLLGRDQAIDRLRGLCLVSMIFGHLTVSGRGGSVVNGLLHAPGWVSGAEGFVFLSGVSVGLLWRSRAGSGGDAKRWTLSRAVMLMVVHLTLNVLAIVWSDLVHATWWMPSTRPSAFDLVSGRWMIPFGDVLPMYAVFLCVASVIGPWADRSPRKVIAGGCGLYLVGLALPAVGPMRTPGDVVWDLFGWQLLFVTGLVAGRHWPAVRRWVEQHRTAVLEAGLASLVAITLLRVVIELIELGVVTDGRSNWRTDFETAWLDKVAMQPLRVLLVFSLGPAFYWVCTHRLPFDQVLQHAGARSLRVYSISTLACLLPPLIGPINSVIANDLMVTGLTVAVLATAGQSTLWRGRPWSI